MHRLVSFELLHKLTLLTGRGQPDKFLCGLTKDLTHHSDLLILLEDMMLVDAYGVYSELSAIMNTRAGAMLEKAPDIVARKHILSVDPNPIARPFSSPGV